MKNIQVDFISYTLAHSLVLIDDYYGLFVQGTSMTEAGIQGGDFVVFKRYYEWIDGAIMLIMQQREGKKFSQMHRVRLSGRKWYQCWEDGSKKKTLLDDSYYPEGILMAIARNNFFTN